jgi:hypothetical protein
MNRALVIALLVAGAVSCSAIDRARPVEASFRLENGLSYDLVGSGGPVTARELAIVEDAALDEIRRAFAGIAVRFLPRREARYTVTVVPRLYDLRLRRTSDVFGNARAMRGLGGRGAVSFYAVASSAEAYAPEGATRADVIAAIGRGVGRVAIHEFIHLFLPRAPIDSSRDPLAFEYGHAARRAQYYGELRWGVARAALLRELGADNGALP